MNTDHSFIPPRYVGSLSDGHLHHAVWEYRRVDRLLARNPSGPGAALRRQLHVTLALLQQEAERRVARSAARASDRLN